MSPHDHVARGAARENLLLVQPTAHPDDGRGDDRGDLLIPVVAAPPELAPQVVPDVRLASIHVSDALQVELHHRLPCTVSDHAPDQREAEQGQGDQ